MMTKEGPGSPSTGKLTINAIGLASGAKIGMSHCPGRNHLDSQGRRWTGDLAADLVTIEAWGAQALVSLIESHEYAYLGVPDLASQVQRCHFDWYHLPIQDMGAPDEEFVRAWAKDGPPILQHLRDGKNILVHCAGGLGRTGTLVARLLVDFGMVPMAAIDTVRRVRPGAIESAAQENHILNYQSQFRENS